MIQPTPLIVGYTTKVRSPSTVREHVAAPPMPGSIKKPDSIAAWRQEKLPGEWDKFDRLAQWVKATGAIDHVVAVDIHKGEVFDSAEFIYGPDDASPGGQFVAWLLKSYPGCFTKHWPTGEQGITFFGFNPKPLLRIAGMNAIRDEMDVPLGLWYANDQCLDPKEMLLETEVKKLITVRKLLEESPLGGVPKIAADYQPHVDPVEDVRLACELCLRYQLIPQFQTSQLIAVIDEGLLDRDEYPVDELPDGDKGKDGKLAVAGDDSEYDEDSPPEKPPKTKKKMAKKKKRATAKS